eukprot:7380303-Prymnesium_polylepis.2
MGLCSSNLLTSTGCTHVSSLVLLPAASPVLLPAASNSHVANASAVATSALALDSTANTSAVNTCAFALSIIAAAPTRASALSIAVVYAPAHLLASAAPPFVSTHCCFACAFTSDVASSPFRPANGWPGGALTTDTAAVLDYSGVGGTAITTVVSVAVPNLADVNNTAAHALV